MVKTNQNRRLRLSKCGAVRIGIAALVIFSTFTYVGAIQKIERLSKSVRGDEEKEILKRMKEHPDVPISLENREGSPLFIQEANVKEITSYDYHRLTGVTTDSNSYVAFPKVKLINNTDKRAIGFALFFINKRTGRIRGFKVSRTTVDPHGEYSVIPNEWVTPDKLTRVNKEGGVVHIKKRVNYDSEKMWLAGSAGDFVLKVAEVDFEDGSRWSRYSSR